MTSCKFLNRKSGFYLIISMRYGPDVFDALTSKRPYKDPYPAEVAFEIIMEDGGKHFDPDMVDVFLENINKQSVILAEIINDLLDGSLIESGKGFTLKARRSLSDSTELVAGSLRRKITMSLAKGYKNDYIVAYVEGF